LTPPLQRSLAELVAANKDSPDPEYRESISHNIVAVARRRAELEALERELARALGHLTTGVAGRQAGAGDDGTAFPNASEPGGEEVEVSRGIFLSLPAGRATPATGSTSGDDNLAGLDL